MMDFYCKRTRNSTNNAIKYFCITDFCKIKLIEEILFGIVLKYCNVCCPVSYDQVDHKYQQTSNDLGGYGTVSFQKHYSKRYDKPAFRLV